jgi:hypothetical protein
MAGYRHPSTTINNIDIIDILVDPSFYDNPIGRQSHWTTALLDLEIWRKREREWGMTTPLPTMPPP